MIVDGPFHRAIHNVPNDKEVIFKHLYEFADNVLKCQYDPSKRSRSDFTSHEGDSYKKYMGNNLTNSDRSKFFMPLQEPPNVAPVMKVVGIYNDNGPDDYQGGFIYCSNWREHRKDNFGEDVGDPNNHIPYWINEQGSLLIVPAWEQVNIDITVSGSAKRTGYHLFGDPYV